LSLGAELVVSPLTNSAILKTGVNLSVDEACLPHKIYLGHIAYLKDKCDAVLIPRLESLGKGKSEMLCTKFHANYCATKNTMPDIPLLDYNIDVRNKQTEYKAFMDVGKKVMLFKKLSGSNNNSHNNNAKNSADKKTKRLKQKDIRLAYKNAKAAQQAHNASLTKKTLDLLSGQGKKILIVGHNYITYDNLLGSPITEFLQKNNLTPILANALVTKDTTAKSTELIKTLYWTYSKHIVGVVAAHIKQVDGIILLTAFPCGPDALVNTMLTLKLKDSGIPILNITLDEHLSNTGLLTRLESFVDITL